MPAVSQLLTFILKDEFHIRHELTVKKKKIFTDNGKYLKEPYYCLPNTLPPYGQFCLFVVVFVFFSRFLCVNYTIWSMWFSKQTPAGRFAQSAA